MLHPELSLYSDSSPTPAIVTLYFHSTTLSNKSIVGVECVTPLLLYSCFIKLCSGSRVGLTGVGVESE